MELDLAADQEEGELDSLVFGQLEDGGRVFGVGAVVEGERDDLLVGFDAPKDLAGVVAHHLADPLFGDQGLLFDFCAAGDEQGADQQDQACFDADGQWSSSVAAGASRDVIPVYTVSHLEASRKGGQKKGVGKGGRMGAGGAALAIVWAAG